MHFRLCKKTIVDCQADSPKPLVPTPPSPAPIKSQKVIKKGQRLTIKSWVVHHVHTSPRSSINVENSTKEVTYIFRRLRGYTRRPH